MQDKQESEIEERVLKDMGQNDDLNSSQSVVMTLEDMQADPSLILEYAMTLMDKQIVEIDKPVFA